MRWALILALVVAGGQAVAQDEPLVCEPVEPIRALSFDSRYVADDPTRATLDVEQEADVLAALAPLDGFIRHLSLHADALYEGRTPDRRRAAECIVGHLANWGRVDALSALGTETVELTIGSRLASFALILWQAAPYTRGSADLDVAVAWLERRVAAQMEFWERAPEGARRGNLRAWAALGGAALSLTSDREDLAPWAVAALEDVVCTAAPDGSLPQEMSRGALALHYQLHAVAPLVTAAAILERQGIAMQEACGGALHRVVAFALDDVNGANRTAVITGKEQTLADEAGQVAGYRMAWLEPYLHLNPDAEVGEMAAEMRPLNYTKLGGNQSALWGR